MIRNTSTETNTLGEIEHQTPQRVLSGVALHAAGTSLVPAPSAPPMRSGLVGGAANTAFIMVTFPFLVDWAFQEKWLITRRLVGRTTPLYALILMKNVILTSCLILAALAARGAETAPAAAAPAGAAASDLPEGFSGKVLETTNTAGYTYLLVDAGAKRKWVAAPAFAVKVNDAVTVASAMAMPNYHSKTLNRDFEVVYFASGVTVNGTESKTPTPPMPAMPKDHPPVGHASISRPGKVDVDLSGIAKADGGKTVAEIFAAKDKLAGQPTKVRGRVVKFNANIMGKNWLHIRDGSGSEGSNDLLVTTAAEAKVGDKVLVAGKIATEKDFGAGYKYSVMVEDAKVTVE